MASISYPTRLKMDGPLLLDAKCLLELDEIIDSCVTKMRTHMQSLVAQTIFEEKEQLVSRGVSIQAVEEDEEGIIQRVHRRYPFKIDSRRIEVFLSEGRTVDSSSFRELMAFSRLSMEHAKGFAMIVKVGDNEVKIEVGAYFRELQIIVSCKDDELAQELFGSLQSWASDIQPKDWLRLWRNSAGFIAPILIGMIVLFAMFLTIYMLVPRSGPSSTQQEALEIAKHGVNPANQARAIQLLLSIETGYDPSPPPLVHVYPKGQMWAYLLLILVLVGAYSRPPKDAIGLWAGKRAVESQRRWIRIVSISVPTALIGSVLIPLIVHYIGLPI